MGHRSPLEAEKIEGSITMDQTKPIDGSAATHAELRHVGIDALVKAVGPVGMARFLQHFNFSIDCRFFCIDCNRRPRRGPASVSCRHDARSNCLNLKG